MTPEQREALHIARYALDRVVDVHVMPVGDRLPDSLYKAVTRCLDEIEEALPVGDLGERPIKLALRALRKARSSALSCGDLEVVDKIQEAQGHLGLMAEGERL